MTTHARYATLVQAQLSNPRRTPWSRRATSRSYRYIEAALLEVAPKEGRAAARQLFVTFSGAVINWCTYAPLLSRVPGQRSPEATAARGAARPRSLARPISSSTRSNDLRGNESV